MTAPAHDGVAAAGRDRRRLLQVLLAISLTLNLCFVGGASWVRLHHAWRPEARAAEVSKELHLTPEQRLAFQHYFRTMRLRFQLMRAELGPIISNAWAEIAKPQPDEAKIEQNFELAGAKRRSFAHDATESTLSFLSTLSPDQRKKFVALLRQHHGFWLRH
ncbi:MAG TPA: periplasmic heavy metal sensor [Stellaceae bacterium]|nr:periplasmic heavy metal sensor [Stellaceae bacterium]